MNLREMAERDMGAMLEDDVAGFANSITLTDPSGKTEIIKGRTGQVHALIDPDTGIPVSVKNAYCSIRIKTLFDLGFKLPKAQPDNTKKPWTAQFADINGIIRKYRVNESRPDQTLGLITLMLEDFKDVA
jgi:hypothetical protein